MGRALAFIYGVVVYAVMFLTFLYLFAFLANILVPKSVDTGMATSFGLAFAINAGLIILFGVPHSVMARPGFKQWWTRIVPEPIERSTYVLVSTLLMILLFWQWRPMGDIVWQADTAWVQGTLWGLFVVGIVLLFASTFVINHFDLFGLRQITLNLLNKPYTYPRLQGNVFLQVRPASAVYRVVSNLLGDAANVSRAPTARDRNERLHSDCYPLRGARPCDVPRR